MGGPSDDLLSGARDAAAEAGYYRFSLSQGVSGASADAKSSGFQMEGAVDVEAGITKLTLRTSGPSLSVNCTYLTSGDVYYTSVHPTRRASVGADWVKSDTGTILAGGAFQFRPDQLFDRATDAFDDLKRSGTATVRGVATTVFTGSLDLSALTQRVSATPLPDAVDLTIPTEIAIDEQGRLRRLTFDLRPSNTPATALSFKSTMELYDFGKRVDIMLPTDAKDANASVAATACFPIAK